MVRSEDHASDEWMIQKQLSAITGKLEFYLTLSYNWMLI